MRIADKPLMHKRLCGMAAGGGPGVGRESGSFTRGVRVLTLPPDQQSLLSEEGAPTLYDGGKRLGWLHP